MYVKYIYFPLDLLPFKRYFPRKKRIVMREERKLIFVLGITKLFRLYVNCK